MIGLIYFVVIVLANTVGAISGMGGGVLIKPILDLIGAHSVAGISLLNSCGIHDVHCFDCATSIKREITELADCRLGI